MNGYEENSPADATLRLVLPGQERFAWLDEPRGWFTFVSAGRCIPESTVRKALAVAPGNRLSLTELSRCLKRDYNRRATPLPAEFVRPYFALLPWLRIEGDEVVADPPLDWREVLTGAERDLVGIFIEHGPILHYEELEVHRGRLDPPMAATTFSQYLSRLPTIQHFRGRGVYSLCGARVGPGELESATGRGSSQASGPIISWNVDGSLRLVWKLSVYNVMNGSLNISAAARPLLPREMLVQTAEGKSLRFRRNNFCCWGFSPFVRGKARSGQTLILTYYPTRREGSADLAD